MGSVREYFLILDASFSYAWRSAWQSIKKAATQQEFDYDLGIAAFYRATKELAREAGIGAWAPFYSNVKKNLAINGLGSYKDLYLEARKIVKAEGTGDFRLFFARLGPLVKGYAAIDSLSLKAYGTFRELAGIIGELLEEKDLKSFRKEFNNRGVPVPYDMIKHLLPQAVVDFIGHYMQDSYLPSFHFTIHRAVEDKKQIGCPVEQIAETIIYMDKEGNNNFFVFTRPHDDFQIPRGVIKTVIGHKDIAKAARLAEENLMNECRTGVMGPFFVKPGDRLFFSAATMDYYADTSKQLVNFSAGTLMKSLYMSLPSGVDVFRKKDQHQVHITEIDDAEKFKIFYKRMKEAQAANARQQHGKAKNAPAAQNKARN